jgi:hypothetical protein
LPKDYHEKGYKAVCTASGGPSYTDNLSPILILMSDDPLPDALRDWLQPETRGCGSTFFPFPLKSGDTARTAFGSSKGKGTATNATGRLQEDFAKLAAANLLAGGRAAVEHWQPPFHGIGKTLVLPRPSPGLAEDEFPGPTECAQALPRVLGGSSGRNGTPKYCLPLKTQ